MEQPIPGASVLVTYSAPPSAWDSNQVLQLMPGLVYAHIPALDVFLDVSPERIDVSLHPSTAYVDITIVGARTSQELVQLARAINAELHKWWNVSTSLSSLGFTVHVGQVATATGLPITSGQWARTVVGEQIDPASILGELYEHRDMP